ncbi:hypothetical protein T02_2199 [Trichinella nativa]|uniref:Uncharacterized protein n=1 Tax=Trichinella nativa TaxID=6335 RepID=A0A0V1L9E5_9BILA|nr:hypothetical protein T02_2199 [Trichinella nativa]KRZ56141.1 hypothetical protein T02_2199 [Trichinella nativa]
MYSECVGFRFSTLPLARSAHYVDGTASVSVLSCSANTVPTLLNASTDLKTNNHKMQFTDVDCVQRVDLFCTVRILAHIPVDVFSFSKWTHCQAELAFHLHCRWNAVLLERCPLHEDKNAGKIDGDAGNIVFTTVLVNVGLLLSPVMKVKFGQDEKRLSSKIGIFF